MGKKTDIVATLNGWVIDMLFVVEADDGSIDIVKPPEGDHGEEVIAHLPPGTKVKLTFKAG